MGVNVPINLASEPFERDRPVVVGLVAMAIVAAVLLAINVATIVSRRDQAKDVRVSIGRLNSQLRAVNANQSQVNTTLRLPQNAEVLDRSLFLNTLIERKAISWTKIFSDLEKVMPYNVRLVAVRLPEVDSQNAVLLDMTVGAKEVPPVLELLKRLEASPQFGPTSVLSSAPPTQTDPYFRYHVSVRYAQKF